MSTNQKIRDIAKTFPGGRLAEQIIKKLVYETFYRRHLTGNHISENRLLIIGTIARSGTAEFLGKLTGDKKKDSNLIGQFGVGFYSVFMIAEKVQVLSRSAQKKSSQPILWESSGEDKYKLTEVEKKSHGTDIIIYLNEENPFK